MKEKEEIMAQTYKKEKDVESRSQGISKPEVRREVLEYGEHRVYTRNRETESTRDRE